MTAPTAPAYATYAADTFRHAQAALEATLRHAPELADRDRLTLVFLADAARDAVDTLTAMRVA